MKYTENLLGSVYPDWMLHFSTSLLRYRSRANIQLFEWWVIFMLLLFSADFFFKINFQQILSGTLSECQTVWSQIRTDILSVLIWFQTVCKNYQQAITKKGATSKEFHSRDCTNPILLFAGITMLVEFLIKWMDRDLCISSQRFQNKLWK